MLETPHITKIAAQRTAFIHVTIPRDQIRHVMGPGLQELASALAAQGIAPTGPWFTHHLKMVPEVFDFEICLPVDALVAAAGRVRPGVRPALKVARTVYVGPYEGLGEAWGELMDWIEAQGLTAAPDLYECYLAGPEASPEPGAWRTELSRPLVG